MMFDKNCIPINTHESRFSKSTARIKPKKHLFPKDFQCAGQLKYLFRFPFVRTFAPKIPVTSFAVESMTDSQ